MGKNGGLEAAWALFNQYWKIGGILSICIIWVLRQNQDHTDQAEIQKHLVNQAAVQDDVLVRQDKLYTFMKDSLTTNDDINSLLGQAQGIHDDLYSRINKLEGDGKAYRYGRGEYRKEYGPMPPQKFRNWFWQDNEH